MTQAGILLAVFSFTGLIGGLAGGAFADRLGRKIMIIAGLLLSAGSSLVMGFINELYVFYIVAAVVGLLADIGRPAREAMIADLLPEEKRGDGFGIFRVMHNLAWVIGPSIGGFLAARSYLNLFITDAVMSSITALVILRFIKDTKPTAASPAEAVKHKGLAETFAGYSKVLKNGLYFFFGAVRLITVGEMIMIPVQMSIVAKLAPENMRGRYMAASGFSWSIATMAGPWAAGLVMDNHDPNLVWKLCGILSTSAVAGFFILFFKTRKNQDFQRSNAQVEEKI